MCATCQQEPCHYRCPNYQPIADCYCVLCADGIYSNEKYVVNDDGEHAHLDCFIDKSELAKWLNYEVKTMKEIN